MPITLLLLVGLATLVDGLLAGASLDQSIKQLPARHRLGARAFCAYSRAADLGNGIVWYAALGIVGAVLCTRSRPIGVLPYVDSVSAVAGLGATFLLYGSRGHPPLPRCRRVSLKLRCASGSPARGGRSRARSEDVHAIVLRHVVDFAERGGRLYLDQL